MDVAAEKLQMNATSSNIQNPGSTALESIMRFGLRLKSALLIDALLIAFNSLPDDSLI